MSHQAEKTGEPASPAAKMTPERAAHLRAMNAVKANFKAVLDGKYLSRTHGDQERG